MTVQSAGVALCWPCLLPSCSSKGLLCLPELCLLLLGCLLHGTQLLMELCWLLHIFLILQAAVSTRAPR